MLAPPTFKVEPSALASVPDLAVALGATGAGELLLQLVTAASRHTPTAKHASFTFISQILRKQVSTDEVYDLITSRVRKIIHNDQYRREQETT